ncbi:SUKH-4 family immunity protein [Streptomyces sp. NBC_00510]
MTAASLAEVFAPEQIVRVRATGQDAGLTHGPTRGFLADVGLPVADGVLFEFRKDLAGGPTPLRAASLVEDLTDCEGGPHRRLVDDPRGDGLWEAVFDDIAGGMW